MQRLFYLLLFSAGLCPFTQGVSHGYILIQEQKSWDEAQAYCRQNHIDLATAESNEDWIELQETLQPAVTLAVWIGLYNNINSWRWSYQDENISFVNWAAEEPNNAGGIEGCAVINREVWCDSSCVNYQPFICYDELRDNRFLYIDIWLTWREAQSYCRQYHTDLVIIRSKAENDQLLAIIPPYFPIWIGLFRDSWKWSDGTNVSTSFMNKRIGQLKITGQNRTCGATDPSVGMIDDQLCSEALPFICMHNSQRWIVRVEVNSGQNLNDPAVINIFLQWIKHKLMGQEMEQITRVRWKVQPDGNVFSPKHD